MLQWLKIADLVVDESYQRPIRDQGRRNVQRIAENFRWARFAPVIVAPVEGGKYAIVDGQHRTTAAALIGIESVPCQVIIADRETQAAAFVAINGAVTKISRMAIHAAAVAAGEPDAVLFQQACDIAEVELLRYPVVREQQKPGQTMSVQAAASCFAQYGRDTFITAMQCVTQTSNNGPGVLTTAMIRALCSVMDKRHDWRDAGAALFEAFDAIDLVSLLERARSLVVGVKGATTSTKLAELIELELAAAMTKEAAE
ncbi:DUF6551 family protein [Alsobacter sp. R-9]